MMQIPENCVCGYYFLWYTQENTIKNKNKKFIYV